MILFTPKLKLIGYPLPNKNQTVEYQISLIKQVIRVALLVLRSVLPIRIFETVYNFLRAIYQFCGHWNYILKTRFLDITANDETMLKHSLTRKLLPFTMGGWKAMHNAFESVALVEHANIAGAIVECGVARGGTSAIMAEADRALGGNKRHKWLFDSYEGLPAPGQLDFEDGRVGEVVSPLGAGDCVGTEAEVKFLMFNILKFETNNVTLVKGWFDKTVPKMKVEVGPICILRLDGDWYESTKVPLENFFDQVTNGGVIIIDDYATCYGSRRAVDEFFEERQLNFKLQPDWRGGAWFQKS